MREVTLVQGLSLALSLLLSLREADSSTSTL